MQVSRRSSRRKSSISKYACQSTQYASVIQIRNEYALPHLQGKPRRMAVGCIHTRFRPNEDQPGRINKQMFGRTKRDRFVINGIIYRSNFSWRTFAWHEGVGAKMCRGVESTHTTHLLIENENGEESRGRLEAPPAPQCRDGSVAAGVTSACRWMRFDSRQTSCERLLTARYWKSISLRLRSLFEHAFR